MGFKLCVHSWLDVTEDGTKVLICPKGCHAEHNKQWIEQKLKEQGDL